MKIYIYIISLLLVLSACSESEPVVEPDTEKDELVINAGVHTTVENQKTRTTSAFVKEFYLYQTQNGATVRNTAFPKGSTNDFNIKDDSNDIIYWDDIGGVSASVNLIGIYPKNDAPAVGDLSLFSWTVASDQHSGTNYENSDLLISNKLTEYTLETQKGTALENKSLTFKHVLSKVKLNLKRGTGFSDDFAPTDVTLLGMNTSLTVEIGDNGSVTTSDLTTPLTNITPKKDAGSYVYEAIVLPGQSFAVDYDFVSFKIRLNGNENTYTAKLTNLLAFASGSEHTFTVTVNKVDLDVVTVTLEEWTSAGEQEETIFIDFEGYSGDEPSGDALTNNAKLYIELDGQKVQYDYTHEEAKWAPAPTPLYLDDINVATGLYADAVLIYNPGDVLLPYVEEIYTGQSQEMNKKYKQLVFGQMKHPFSKVNITIRTEKDKGYSVDLTKLTNIEFNEGIKQFKEIDLDVTSVNFRKITCESKDVDLSITTEGVITTEPTYEYYTLPDPLYIEPINFLSEVELLRIFYNDNTLELTNEYPLVTAANFEANKEYSIVITLRKTEIAEVGVTIEAWGSGGTINGNAGIDK